MIRGASRKHHFISASMLSFMLEDFCSRVRFPVESASTATILGTTTHMSCRWKVNLCSYPAELARRCRIGLAGYMCQLHKECMSVVMMPKECMESLCRLCRGTTRARKAQSQCTHKDVLRCVRDIGALVFVGGWNTRGGAGMHACLRP